MAIREWPRRMQRADVALRDLGGLQAYVESRLARGDRVSDILRAVNAALHPDGPIVAKTLYGWIHRWRDEVGERKETVAA